jgi:integrase
VLTLQRRQLDLEAGTLRLDAGTTKNEDGRLVYLTPERKALLAAQLERVEALQRQLGRIIPHLFPHLGGRHRGEQIRDSRKAWSTACRKAGVPGRRLRHDFRRTAVRNMNGGVPERIEGDGTSDAGSLRPLTPREPGRSPGRRPKAGGYGSGHVGGASG